MESAILKRKCTPCPAVPAPRPVRNAHPAWELHPSWKMALDSLDAYSRWVSEIVIPIAFEWIEEHKDEVYRDIPKRYQEDIGVVISAAFELVRNRPTYARGLEYRQQIEDERREGTLNTSDFNPVWTAISTEIEEDVEETFAKYRDVLQHSGEELPESVA